MEENSEVTLIANIDLYKDDGTRIVLAPIDSKEKMHAKKEFHSSTHFSEVLVYLVAALGIEKVFIDGFVIEQGNKVVFEKETLSPAEVSDRIIRLGFGISTEGIKEMLEERKMSEKPSCYNEKDEKCRACCN